jgi:arylsulfatase A
LRERTVVVFQSDNGHSTEERAHFGGGSAGPYRGEKFSLFEGGIRLPAIISWPGQLPQGQMRAQVVHACDWMPTVAELCGVKLLNDDIDGRSIVPVVRSASAPSPHDVLHWHVGAGKQAQWAVRQGDWKLIGNVQSSASTNLSAADKELFLVNLATDVSEKTNVAKRFPEVTQRLLKLREDWMAANKSLLPAPANVRDGKGNEK